MTTVILLGSGGKKITEEICRILSVYGITKVIDETIGINSQSPRFLIIKCNDTAKVNVDEGVVLVIGKIGDCTNLMINGSFKGVVFSSDKEALRLLKSANITTITCGMASEDTLSLSSIREDSAFVSLNRSIETLSGNIIEPQEHKINIENPITDYALLAASAILLYSGIDPEGLTC